MMHSKSRRRGKELIYHFCCCCCASELQRSLQKTLNAFLEHFAHMHSVFQGEEKKYCTELSSFSIKLYNYFLISLTCLMSYSVVRQDLEQENIKIQDN